MFIETVTSTPGHSVFESSIFRITFSYVHIARHILLRGKDFRAQRASARRMPLYLVCVQTFTTVHCLYHYANTYSPTSTRGGFRFASDGPLDGLFIQKRNIRVAEVKKKKRSHTTWKRIVPLATRPVKVCKYFFMTFATPE